MFHTLEYKHMIRFPTWFMISCKSIIKFTNSRCLQNIFPGVQFKEWEFVNLKRVMKSLI